jgi:steroid delta-isomerase-like uncharacterized protein
MNEGLNGTVQANKRLVEELYTDCINAGSLERLDDLIHEDFVGPRGEKGPEGYTQTIAMVRAGFPDVHFRIEDLIGENDRVVARWRMEGTHLGPFAGFPASGKRVMQTAIVIYRIKDGKLVRAWLQRDSLGLLQQIGAIPALPVNAPKA